MSGYCLFVMAKLQILLLVVVPLCSAQFKIQGPSDGNRRAQGLQYDREKGIQYDDQRASVGTGDFTIQGATDGNTNFQIQGASDGNSDFQIYGATDGSAQSYIRGPTDANAQFQIQGATDGHSQSSVQGPYDANQGSGTSLQYKDPSGLNVNWKTYQPAQRAQPQAQPHYAPAPAPAPRKKRPKQQYLQNQAPIQQAIPDQQALAPGKNPYYKMYDKAPPQIAMLLQYQQQIPYFSIIPEQFRFNFDSALNMPVSQGHAQRQQVQQPQEAPEAHAAEPPSRAPSRGRARGYSRQKRQAPNRRQAQKVTQPPVEPQPQYKTHVPSRIQELIQFQAQIPYINHIPEKWRYEALLAQQGQRLKSDYQRQPEPEPVRHSQRVRQKRQAQQQHQSAQQDQVDLSKYQRIAQPPPDPQINYRTNLPANLQQLLNFQSQTPYTSAIPEQFSYEKLIATQGKGQRKKRQAQQQHQSAQQDQVDLSKYQRIAQPPSDPQINYRTNLPANLQQLLKFQSQTPYTSAIPEQFSYEKLIAGQGNGHRQKRQAPQYQQQQPDLSQYQRIAQPAGEPTPQYSTNIPGSIQQLLQFQSQVPYDIIANRITARLDKPYVPQPISTAPVTQYQPQPQPQPQPQQLAQPQQLPLEPDYQQPQYQQNQQYQGPAFSPQYQQPQQPLNPGNQQSQLIRPQYHPNEIVPYQSPQYNSPQNNIRPVTENQY